MLLGITVDKDLKFDDGVNSLCKKAYQKLDAHPHLAPEQERRKKDNHQSIRRVSIWILSLSLDVP